MLHGTYSRLRDGGWGVRLVGAHTLRTGARVEVTTKAGRVKSEVLSDLLWQGTTTDGRDEEPIELWSIVPRMKSPAAWAQATAPQGNGNGSSVPCPTCGR